MKKSAPNPNQLHREQLVYIGQILREARETAGLSHGALAEKTLIRLSLLKAIEIADISQLPEPVYTRGLIRRYGESLGLDGEALAIQYFTPSTQKVSRSFWRLPVTPQLRPMHLYLTYVMLIGIAISALSYTLQRMAYQNSTLPVLEGEVAEDAIMPEGGPGASEEDTAPPAANPDTLPPEVADSPIRVSVQLQEQSWLRITTDGEVTFEGIMKEGESEIWTAKEQVRVRAGNAGGVRVSFNEGNAEVLGRPGMVAEAIYPPSTAQISPR
ncbi:MAG: RodZ domain-containing protein [Cyanobacteria bacterium P01_H01_bin.152]